MPETATLIVKVDLQCCRCSKKIKKVLCKIQNKARIQSITYDDKNNSITISGLFDPEILCKKLRCKACRVILDIEIKKTPPEKKTPPTEKTEKVVMKFPDCLPPSDNCFNNNNNNFQPQLMWPPAEPVSLPLCCPRPCPCYVEGHIGYCRCCTCGRTFKNDPPPPPKKVTPEPAPAPTPVVPYYGGCSSSCGQGCRVVYMDENPTVGCAIM